MSSLPVAMLADEFALFLQFVHCADSYLEFGSGGSTCVAAQYVPGQVISVDSSAEWLDRVRTVCDHNKWKTPKLLHVDIGGVRELGYPTQADSRSLWPNYHQSVWKIPESRHADFYLVDGRFRVACFLQVLLRCDETRPIGIHDYADRTHYHIISNFADEIARASQFSIFIKKQPFDRHQAERILEEFSFNPE